MEDDQREAATQPLPGAQPPPAGHESRAADQLSRDTGQAVRDADHGSWDAGQARGEGPDETFRLPPPRLPDPERVRGTLGDAEAQAERVRPEVQPTTKVGRWLRAVAGVDESLLDRFPGERSKYTALGGVILGTAAIAGVSMWFAVHHALGESPWAAVVIAVVWAAFIANLDRWLVSSMSLNSTRSGWSRFVLVLPRLALAVLFAVVIAEPLVLRLFDSAIVAEVDETRRQEVRDLESQLRLCNPQVPVGVGVLPPGCPRPDAVLSVRGAPISEMQRLDALKAQFVVDKAALEADRKQLARMYQVARRECTGRSGDGLTGVPGEGFNCLQDRREADDFRDSANVDGRQRELDRLAGRIGPLTDRTNAALVRYGAAVDTAIDAKVDELRSSQREVGLLERVAALGVLSRASEFVNSATWALRLLFIAIECLPVLVKVLSGPGFYERALVERLRVGQDLDRERAASEDAVERLPLGVQRMLAEHDLAAAREEVSVAREVDRAQHSAVLGAVKGRAFDVRRPAPEIAQRGPRSDSRQVEAGRENGHGSADRTVDVRRPAPEIAQQGPLPDPWQLEAGRENGHGSADR